MKSVDVLGLHVESTSGSLLLLLREHDAPHRVLPIVIGENEALSIALVLENQAPPRPLTHDLIVSLVESLDAQVGQVEVTELRDGAFLAELTVTGPHGERRVDSRPSDAIALAMRVDAPLFVAEAVLDQAGAVLPVVTEDDEVEGADEAEVVGMPPEEEVIEQEVDRFRAFLDDLDPDDFVPPGTGEEDTGDEDDDEGGGPRLEP